MTQATFCWKPKSFGDKFCQYGSWVANGNRIQTWQHPVCMCVEATKQATNKQMTNKPQVCEAKMSFNDKINAKQSHELKCESYMLKKLCEWP